MKANETTVRNLLQGERQYIVPLYQRPYSWGRTHLRKLWDDLLSLTEGESDTSHFMGSIVLAPNPANTPAGVQKWLVVDGQQRLTALSILLCAIRDHVRGDDDRLASKIDDLYLFNKYADESERYTLLPTQADRDAWMALLECSHGAGGEDGIGDAYRFFLKELKTVDDPEDPHDVTRIEQAITSQVSIVEIAAHQDDNVHRIFESLNHTGQPLTQADLLRNYLFMRLPSRGEHVFQHRWLPLQKMLSDKQLEELVWLDLVLRGDDRATQEAIYQSQQHQLEGLTSEAELEDWVTELHRKARLFHKIVEPTDEPSPVLRRVLERLSRWGAQVVHPIALHVLLAHEDNRLDEREVENALRVVESFLVRRMITRIGSSGVNRILMSLVKDLGGDVPTAAAITRVLSGVRKRFPTDRQLQEAIQSNNFYWTGRGNQRTFVLRCLEEDYPNGEPIDFTRSDLTIEHVLPQSPSQEWLDMLGDDAEGETPEERHSALVHTLGNLTLTAYNAKLGNDGFEAKKKILGDSGLKMNREIADTAQWTEQDIRARGRRLAKRAVRIWPGPDESAAAARLDSPWRRMTQVLASIPAGRWTSYSDVAEVIGSHQVSVSAQLTSNPVANAHRVLKRNGEISSDFRWPDPECEDDPKNLLRSEGVQFDEKGRASAPHRLSATELARLIDLDTDIPEIAAVSAE